MSQDAVKTFYMKLVGNERLTARVNDAAGVDERLAIALDEGCEFTREEFEAVTHEIVESEASVAQFFGGDHGDAVGYAALLMLPVRSMIRPLYGPDWFFERGKQVSINRTPMRR